MPPEPLADPPTSLRELATLFGRLGATALGGPAAHVAMMRREVVGRRRWLTEQQFLDLLGATSLIPGPSSTEMAIHVGWARRRWAGLLVAGVSFIVPATLITTAVAWAYVRFGSLPEVGWLFYGVKPVVLAIVFHAVAGLAPTAARSWPLRLLGIGAAVAVAAGVDELGVLLGAGASVAALRVAGRREGTLPLIPVLPPLAAATAAATVPASLPAMFLVFAKIGSVLFGSGYVLVAFLRSELVERLHWLTEAQLIDAVAVGQLTPGPVFTTATFIGYLLAGPEGAFVATVGIFLPAFVFVALSAPLLPWLRRSDIASGFLDGVNVASVALMAVVSVQLGGAALVDVPTGVIGLVAVVLLLRSTVGPSALVVGGALCGIFLNAGGLGR